MSTVIFTAGAKGGTGKSTIIRFLITYLRERGYEPLLLDMDNENRTLSRFFPESDRAMNPQFSEIIIYLWKLQSRVLTKNICRNLKG